MPDQESGLPQTLIVNEQQAILAGICSAICGAFLMDDIESAMTQLNVLRKQLKEAGGIEAFNDLSNGCMAISRNAGWLVNDEGLFQIDLSPRRKD